MEIEDEDRVYTFVGGLNDSDTSIREHIINMEALPSIDRVYQMMVQEEHQRTLNTNTTPIEATTLYTQKKYIPPKGKERQVKKKKRCVATARK